jgi:hypothetical protein
MMKIRSLEIDAYFLSDLISAFAKLMADAALWQQRWKAVIYPEEQDDRLQNDDGRFRSCARCFFCW